MRVLVTGASGFVGSNIVKVLEDLHDDDVIGDRVDMFDADAIAAQVAQARPEGVIHCAIINDWDAMIADRHYAWDGYVTSTKAYAEAAQRTGVPFVLVSTDWVFDGTQGPAAETTPPNPVNLYGFLKAASEIVALDRGGAVARVSGVNGTHWARPSTPRLQDPGFGYFVASLVDAVERGEPFTVWEAPMINMVASPSLASMCGEVMRAIIANGETGTFHCCGAESMSRRQLALAAVDTFDLPAELVRFAPPPTDPPMPIPYDTSLDASASAVRLGYRLPSAVELLAAFRAERATGAITRFLPEEVRR